MQGGPSGRLFCLAPGAIPESNSPEVTKGHLPSVLRGRQPARYIKDRFPPVVCGFFPFCGQEFLKV
jgi:hypothetical protein